VTEDDLNYEATFYWQDSLAKFFPDSVGPTNTEVLMFKAGFELASKQHQELEDLKDPYGF